jgi:hypothetical protein
VLRRTLQVGFWTLFQAYNNYLRVEYATEALSGYIKRVLEAAVKFKQTDEQQLELTEEMMLQAIKSQVKNREYHTTSLYSTSIECMRGESIIMHSDSESDESSFEDPSAEDDMADLFAEDQQDNSEDEEEIPEDFTSLNDLIKVREFYWHHNV